MTADAAIMAVVDALGLPPAARVDARVPKKLLIEQGAPTAADRRAIQEGIDEIQWFAACKPATIGVQSYTDDQREYLEIAIVGCVFRAGAKATRLIALIHRAIPYPVLLVTAAGPEIVVSAAHKRNAQNEAGRVVIDHVVGAALALDGADKNERDFLESLSLARQPRTDLFALYSSWLARLEAMNAARLTDVFVWIEDGSAIEERRVALEEHKRLSQEAARLRGLAASAKLIRQKVDLNIQLQIVNEKLSRQKRILRGGA